VGGKNRRHFSPSERLGGDVTKQYGLYNPKYKAARRVNYLIDKSGKVVEMQIDSDAVDPTKIVTLCERRKTKD